jgi:ParB family chromosome partitioning protein
VTNTIRLLQLPPPVQRLLAEERISAGHARSLLTLDEEEAQEALALRVAAEGLSVRQVEDLVRGYRDGAGGGAAATSTPEPDPRLAEVQEALADALGTRVRIQPGKRKGKLVIEFASEDDLTRIVDVIVGRT